MGLLNEKLTPKMREFISNLAQTPEKRTAKMIKEALLQEFDLPSDYISERRISTLCKKARTTGRGTTRNSPPRAVVADDPVINVLNKQTSTLKKKITHEKLRQFSGIILLSSRE